MVAPTRSDSLTTFPIPLTPLVGREREIAVTGDLLCRSDIRLVTLTGPGGVGKTRLALRTAELVTPRFSDGVRFVNLAPISDPSLVPVSIADTLGVLEGDATALLNRIETVFRDKHVLLVLDNVEQVATAAPLFADLLVACPGLTILVTSRVRLRVSAEQEYPVQPLAFAQPDSATVSEMMETDAVRLFAARARSVRPEFTLDAENAATVAAICAQLDGLPLAIELAAARVKTLPPAALLSRLRQRLPLLVDGPRDAPERLQTMRNAIAWSYDLLPPDEQVVFRRLAVFVGGFTLEAAESMSEGNPDTLDLVASLVDKSLLRAEPPTADEPRFGMLETIREFGLEQLAASGEADDVRDQHARWCIELSTRANTFGTAQAGSLARLSREHDNLRAALTWLLGRGDAERAQKLVGKLWEFWFMRGHAAEGSRWVEQALALGAASPPARAGALTGAGALTYQTGNFEEALVWLGEGAELARELDDHLLLGFALGLQGNVMMARANYDEAIALFSEEFAAQQRAGHDLALASATLNLGRAIAASGDRERGERLLEQARIQLAAGDSHWELGCAIYSLGRIAQLQGNVMRAGNLYREALTLFQELSDPMMALVCLEGLAAVAARGDALAAARLLGAAAVVRAWLGRPAAVEERQLVAETEAIIRSIVGEEAFTAAFAVGQSLSLAAATEEGLGLTLPEPLVVAVEAPAAPHGLTRRERDVLRLLAEGKSDREIADTLFLSYRTVTSYVTNILGKLGVDSRTAAATYAVRHDLV